MKIPKTNKPTSLNLSDEIRQSFLGEEPYPEEKNPAVFRVVMYSHDTMGIGHMRRNLLIAHAIKKNIPNASVLVIAGAKEASIFAHEAGIDCLTLPSFQKRLDGAYTSRNLGIPAADVLDLRSRTILSAIQSYQPDLLIADKIPCGAGGELLPSLEWLTKATSCRCVLGLREILDSADTVIEEWQKMRAFEIIRRHFDSIWIYGDPTVFDAVGEYMFSADIAERATYTGYLDARTRLSNSSNPPVEKPYVLCTFGGGQDGKALALQFVEAMRVTGRASVLLTGPYMPDSDKATIQELATDIPSLKIIEFANEGDLLIKHASHVVSMGGYNTLSAILSYKKTALVVPRVKPRTEQLIRANRLAELGHVHTISPDQLTSCSIVDWLNNSGQSSPSPVANLDLGGLDRICELIRAKLPANFPTINRSQHHVDSQLSQ